MKRFHILILSLLFGTLACGVVPADLPTLAPTIPAPAIASPTLPPTDEAPTSQAFVEEAGTNLPPVTVPAPAALPQPAVAHHKSGEPIALDRITMFDALTGWGISAGDVLFTADGAQTWREVTPPEMLTPGSQIQAQGAFLDAQHAWVIFSFDRQISPGAVVWHTSDSGHTWTASAPLEHLAFGELVWAEFFALDEAHLWLMMRGVYVGAGTHYSGQFLRSTDGGRTWLPLTGSGNFDYNYNYTGLVFVDSDHGLVTWQTTGAYAPSPPEYAVTSDGAVNWEIRQLPPPADTPDLFDTSPYCEPFQPHMLSSQSIRLLVGCFDFHDPPEVFSSYLYVSEDAGSTWTSTHLPEKVLANQATLFFFDKDNALLLDRDIYRSVDGGQTWEYVKSVTWDAQFTFVDPQTGWAVARADDQTALVKTSSGGDSWIEIKLVIAP